MSQGPGTTARLLSLDGETLKAALATAARWLDQRASAINALNVFPVPDGDTGLNMSLTLRSAAEEAASAGSSVGQVATAIARGALLGSRGNSGVILAKLLGGVAAEVADCTVLDARKLALALQSGANAAYEAISNPVEGTILTVARAAAAGALRTSSQDVLAVLEAAHRSAQLAVAETPDLLPVLKQASVVDAGGEGYRVVLEGLLFHLRGEALPEDAGGISAWADLSSIHQADDDFYGYCTEVLVQGRGLDAGAIRKRVSELGTSVLVVGDEALVKVHVHTTRPGSVLDLATELGELVKVKVDNMQLQHQQFAALATTETERKAPRSSKREPGTALVVVASGSGLKRVFESLGAVVVDGADTMNPPVKSIVRAIEATAREDVLVLPNNKNVVLAAQEAAGLATDRSVRVLPSRNVAQGVAAALALNPEAGVEHNLEGCRTAAARARCIELTYAARSAKLEGLRVDQGQCFALLDDEPVAAADGFGTVLGRALERLSSDKFEIGTIYVGAGGTSAEAEDLRQLLSNSAGVEVEIVSGEQPNYPYIISLE